MDFLIGFLGALLAMLLLGAGAVAGWLGHQAWVRRNMPKAAPAGEQERERLLEQQQAFQCLQNYSAERAYGMAGEELFCSRK